MKKLLLIAAGCVLAYAGFSQEKIVKKIKETVVKEEAVAHLGFLASDEMRGRDTGSPEIAIASNYIAAQFQILGVKPTINSAGYFQEVGLISTQPPKTLELKLVNDVFHFRDDLLLLKGKATSFSGSIVFVGHGTEKELSGLDLRGKIVVVYTGKSDSSKLMQAYLEDGPGKYDLVKQRGGLALIEVVEQKEAPWSSLVRFLGGPGVGLSSGDESPEMPYIWMRNSTADGLMTLLAQKSISGSLRIEVPAPVPVPGRNVIGVIEGTDPVLKEEYIILSAHYDHIGIRHKAKPDSICNGARDNALGTTAILEAAKFFSKNPVKRSLIIIALCGEEQGLLGSRWYSDHPVFPLNKTVFNFDCDGAGYNDKTIATLIDLNRTTADALLVKGCEPFGLGLKGDPAPSENLYERSDNYSFAAKGVPAVDFGPGVKEFDAELMKYYHQPADEVASLDLDYIEKFIRSYVYCAYLVGNADKRPMWKAGDKFEPTGNKLYGLSTKP